MSIYVCVKHVPDTAANIRVSGCDYDDSVKFIINPYDEYAIEEAVRTKRLFSDEVVVLTAGPPGAEATIRSALAMGADRGVHIVVNDKFCDPRSIASAMAKVIGKDPGTRCIFSGKLSIDTESGVTHLRLGAELGIPAASDVIECRIQENEAMVTCEAAGKRILMTLKMPCVIGVTKGINEPRYPKLPDILKAKKKRIERLHLSDLAPDFEPGFELESLVAAPERKGARMLEGSVDQVAEELIRILSDEEKIL